MKKRQHGNNLAADFYGRTGRARGPLRWLVQLFAGLLAIITCAVAAAPANPLNYPTKPAFYQSWAQFGSHYTQAALLRTLTSVSNLHLAEIYSPFVIIVDGGWAAPNRDSAGRLQFDIAKFPDGTNIVNLIHSYGCKALLWVEYNGPITTPTTGTPSTFGTNVEYDAETIAGWGFDGAKFDLIDAVTGDGKISLVTRFINAFRGVATNRQTYFYHDVNLGMDRGQFDDFPPGAVICENSENDSGKIVFWTESMLTHLFNANSRNHWSCGREVYEFWWYGPSFFKVWSMLGSPYVFTALTDAHHYPSYNYLYNRRECIALNNDPLYAAPELLFHTSTNLALLRKRADGTVTALAFNTTENATQTITLSFSQLGLPAAAAANVRDIFSETNCGTFSQSYICTLGPMESALLTFDSEARVPILASSITGENIELSIQGRPGHTIVLQKSGNLQTWPAVATNTLSGNPWIYSSVLPSTNDKAFFRAIRHP
jgi:hypothetical protein